MADPSQFSLSAAALLISLLSAVAATGSWLAGRRMVEMSRSASQASALMVLFNFLHEREQREARARVRSREAEALDMDAAKTVCSAFDFSAILVRSGIVDTEIFLDYWGDMLRYLDRRLVPILDQELFGGLTGRQYWRSFAWLLMQASQRGGPQSPAEPEWLRPQPSWR